MKKRWILSILGTLLLAGVLLIAIWAWRFDRDTSVKVVSAVPSQVKAAVASVLARAGVGIGSEPQDRGNAQVQSRLAAGIIEARGVSEGGGFHGDGMDWYEAKLSPELREDVERVLEKEAIADQPAGIIRENAPHWFPRTFPSGTLFYKGGKRLEWLALPPGEDRIWVVRMRT